MKNGKLIIAICCGFFLMFAGIAIICAPNRKKDPRIIHPQEIKFLTVDGDTAILTNWGHVNVEVHKRK